MKVDRYGNLITNFRATDFAGDFVATVGGMTIGSRSKSYAGAAPGEAFLIEGSSGYWEVAVSQSSAARLLDVHGGDSLTLHFGKSFQNVR